MGRKFTESEVLAMTRNRREDKALKETLHKLSEARGFYHDNLKKERKKISQFCVESQRTSGNSPCPDCQVSCNKSDHVTPRQMQRHNKPWSVTPSESTFNVLFKQNDFATTESRKMRRRTNGLRKSSSSRNSSELRNTDYPLPTVKSNHEEKNLENFQKKFEIPEVEGINRAFSSTPVPIEDSPQVNNPVSTGTESNKGSKNSKDRTNRPKSVRILSPRTRSSKLAGRVNMSATSHVTDKSECSLQELGCGNETNKTEGVSIGSESSVTGNTCTGNQMGEAMKVRADGHPGNSNRVKDDLNDRKNERVNDENCRQGKENMATIEKQESEKTSNRLTLPVLDEIPDEDFDDKANHEYVLVYTLPDDEKIAGDGTPETGGPMTHESEDKIFSAQTSLDDGQVQIVNVALDNDGTAAITLSHVEKQRPHTVAGGEVFVEDPDLKSLPDVDHGDFMWFRGKKLHNYVKPQDRYKHDPFKMKKREKLMKKLATETPVFAEDQREQILNVEMTFSKATRARLLKQLVEENSSKRHTNSRNSYEQTLNTKIDHFMKSIEDFCDKQRQT